MSDAAGRRMDLMCEIDAHLSSAGGSLSRVSGLHIRLSASSWYFVQWKRMRMCNLLRLHPYPSSVLAKVETWLRQFLVICVIAIIIVHQNANGDWFPAFQKFQVPLGRSLPPVALLKSPKAFYGTCYFFFKSPQEVLVARVDVRKGQRSWIDQTQHRGIHITREDFLYCIILHHASDCIHENVMYDTT